MTRNAGKQDNLKYRYVDTSVFSSFRLFVFSSIAPMFQCSSNSPENRKPETEKSQSFKSPKVQKFTRSELKSKHQKSKIKKVKNQKPTSNNKPSFIGSANARTKWCQNNSKTPKPQNPKTLKLLKLPQNRKIKKWKNVKNEKMQKMQKMLKSQKCKNGKNGVLSLLLLHFSLSVQTPHTACMKISPSSSLRRCPSPFRFCALRCCSSLPNKRRQLGNSIQWNPISGYILYHHSTVRVLFTYTCVLSEVTARLASVGRPSGQVGWFSTTSDWRSK